jgi:hypothetical protein
MTPSAPGAAFGNEPRVSRCKPPDFEPFGAVSAIGIGGFRVVGVTQDGTSGPESGAGDV